MICIEQYFHSSAFRMETNFTSVQKTKAMYYINNNNVYKKDYMLKIVLIYYDVLGIMSWRLTNRNSAKDLNIFWDDVDANVVVGKQLSHNI